MTTAYTHLSPAIDHAAFRVAERHSRLVRRLRVALPLAGLLLFAGVAVTGVVTRIGISLSVGDLAITAEGLAMDAPRLSGSDGKGRVFEVTAERAVQDLGDPRIIRLYEIRAEIRQANGNVAAFAAGSGIYDTGRQSLVLENDISIRASDGTAATLKRAAIDVTTGEVQSDAPVAFSSSLGAIEASTMQVGEKGSSVTFSGGVRMTVDPDAIEAAKDGKGDLFGISEGNDQP